METIAKSDILSCRHDWLEGIHVEEMSTEGVNPNKLGQVQTGELIYYQYL